MPSASPRGPLASALILTALLGGCATDIGPRPQIDAQSAPAAQRTFAAAPTAPAPAGDWWTAFGDAQLNALIDEALAGSPSLQVAAARIAQAETQLDSTIAASRPDVTGQASVGETRQSLNTGFPDAFKAFLPQGWHDQARAAVEVNQRLDFFGRLKAGLAAANLNVDATQADADEARLMLSTSVAGAYADLVQLFADRAALEEAIKVRGQTAQLLQQRFNEGVENRGPAARAEAALASARTELAQIDGRIALTRNQIAALVGAGPDRGLQIQAPGAPVLKPIGLPPTLAADLIGRRPDVAAARARAQAAAAQEDLARLEFYPNINLTAVIGLQSLPASKLLQADSQYGNVGPALSLPIFDGGAIEARYRGRRAVYEQAVAEYQRTVVQAYQDVADALARLKAQDAQMGEAQAGLKAAEEAYSIARQRYDAGLDRYLDVLSAEDAVLAQRRRIAGLQSSTFNLDIALIRALGGGYTAPSPQ